MGGNEGFFFAANQLRGNALGGEKSARENRIECVFCVG